jgi:tetratricopeptide (TPR) repeat protein
LFGKKSEGAIVPRMDRVTNALAENRDSTPTLKSAVSKTDLLESPNGDLTHLDKAGRERILEQADELIANGQNEDAKHLLDQLVRRDYRNARAYYALGNISLKNGDFASALKNFFFAHFVQPSDPQYKIATSECEQLINQKLNPHYHNYHLYPDKGDVHAIVNQGVRFFALGKAAEAKDCFEQALRFQSHNADACYNLGAMAEFAGDLPQAMNFYEHARYYAGTQINDGFSPFGKKAVDSLLGGLVHASSGPGLEELQATFADANRAIAELKVRIAKSGNNAPLVFVTEAQIPVCPVCRISRQTKMYPD